MSLVGVDLGTVALGENKFSIVDFFAASAENQLVNQSVYEGVWWSK